MHNASSALSGFFHLMSTGYFRVIAGKEGVSTVSTSVNNTTVLKEKILPITSSSAQPTEPLQVFLCAPTENVDFRGFGSMAARYLLGWM